MTSSPKKKDTANDNARPKIDFSIDHILNRAGTSESDKKILENSTMAHLSWLQCTRYCPPKIARNQKKEGPQKRQLGRHPRIPFTTQQLAILEEKFRQTPYLSSSEVTKLSRNLQLADIRVKIWFQNRRARERRERGQLDKEQTTLLSSNYLESQNCSEMPLSRSLVSYAESVPVPSSSASEKLNLRLPEFSSRLSSAYNSTNFSCAQRYVNFQSCITSDDSS